MIVKPIVRRIEKRSKNEVVLRTGRRTQRMARYDQVRALSAQGVNIRRIAQQLKMSRMTVRQFVKTATYPEVAPHSRTGVLTPFEPYLHQRWMEGCAMRSNWGAKSVPEAIVRKPITKWRNGSACTVRSPSDIRAGVSALQCCSRICLQVNMTRVSQLPVPSAERLAGLLVKDSEQLNEKENLLPGQLLQDPAVAKSYSLAQQFTKMVRYQLPKRLTAWLKGCQDSGIPEFVTFANGSRAFDPRFGRR